MEIEEKLRGKWLKIEVQLDKCVLQVIWEKTSEEIETQSYILRKNRNGNRFCFLEIPKDAARMRLPLDPVSIQKIWPLRLFVTVFAPHIFKTAKKLIVSRKLLPVFSEMRILLRKEGLAPFKELFKIFAKSGDLFLARRYLSSRVLNQEYDKKSAKALKDNSFTISKERQGEIPRLIAFYLPQFHPIPLNDLHWGNGFTEWRNVTKAVPLFNSHYQPRHPADLGYYDLRVADVAEQQAALARTHGISAFCYYFYWFQGTKLLELPINRLLESKKPDFPFCFCWANESWTQRWGGMGEKVILEQDHSLEDDLQFIRNILPAFHDHRYLRVNEKPVLLVYKTDLFPNPKKTAELWRSEAKKAGLKDLYLIRCEQKDSFSNPEAMGFDASYELPVSSFPDPLRYDFVKRLQPVSTFKGEIFDYGKVVEYYTERQDVEYKRYNNLVLAWDNTPRYGVKGTILHGATPELYGQWLKLAIERTMNRFEGEERLVFINAWNEWGEGSYLEPDLRYGTAFLNSTRIAVEQAVCAP